MRYPDWTSRLRAAVAQAGDRAFAWGGHDCVTAVFELVNAIADVEDLAWWARGKYKTAAGARKELARYLKMKGPGRRGDDLLAMAMTRRFEEVGLQRVDVSRAQRGDIVLVDAPTANGIQSALAIVDLTGRGLLAASRRGWATLPIAAGRMAWRI